MAREAWTRGLWGRGVLITALLLIAAAGFCMFEGAHDGDHHHAASVDLCSAMVAASFAPIVLIALLAAGAAVILSAPRAPSVTRGVPVPPPKFIASL